MKMDYFRKYMNIKKSDLHEQHKIKLNEQYLTSPAKDFREVISSVF